MWRWNLALARWLKVERKGKPRKLESSFQSIVREGASCQLAGAGYVGGLVPWQPWHLVNLGTLVVWVKKCQVPSSVPKAPRCRAEDGCASARCQGKGWAWLWLGRSELGAGPAIARTRARVASRGIRKFPNLKRPSSLPLAALALSSHALNSLTVSADLGTLSHLSSSYGKHTHCGLWMNAIWFLVIFIF